LEAQSGCVTQTPYPVVGCAFVRTTGTQTTFVLQGTLYAPRAAVDVEVPNASVQIFGRGVIDRTLRVNMTASAKPTGAIITVPGGTGVADRTVLFTATIGGTARLRALVTFADGGGASPGQSVTVKSWAVIR
jgi:hypothetical protein